VFRLHLPALMARREHDESRLRLQIDALGLEHFEWTQPELEKRRDDLAVAERRAARHSAALEREALASQAVRLQTALDTATSEALRYHADANRASGQIHELHRSLSWRLTQPLRSISGWIRRVTGGRS
jgi:hypothetical protein